MNAWLTIQYRRQLVKKSTSTFSVNSILNYFELEFPKIMLFLFLFLKDAPQIKFLNSKVFQKKGERVIFDCNVNSNPLSKIYWYKNQTRIYESHKFNFENLDDSYHRLYINVNRLK